jgi:hypothetical protein
MFWPYNYYEKKGKQAKFLKCEWKEDLGLEGSILLGRIGFESPKRGLTVGDGYNKVIPTI